MPNGTTVAFDPIEGGSANDYDYALGDPVNGYDLDGQCAQLWKKKCRDTQLSRLGGAASKFAAGVASGKRYVEARGHPGGRIREASGHWVKRLGAKLGAGIAAGAVALTTAICSTGVGCVLLGLGVAYAANRGGSYVSQRAGWERCETLGVRTAWDDCDCALDCGQR